MTDDPYPPQWAERALQTFLTLRSYESVSGDLLEEYRDTVFPAHGRRGADVWYLRQVFGYAWRSAGVWAALFALAFLIRDAIDMRVPTTDFHTRSTVSTSVAIGIFLLVGYRAGSRSGSIMGAAIAGLVTAAIAVPLQLIGAVLLTALWHDSTTLSAIRASGGLGEVFSLPFFTVLPGVLISAMGGMLGATMTRSRPAQEPR